MGLIFIGASVSILLYLAIVMMIPRHVIEGSGAYTRHMLNRIQAQGQVDRAASVSQEEDPHDNPLVRAFLLTPLLQRSAPLIQRAGLWHALDKFVLALLLVYLFTLLAMGRLGPVSIPLAAVVTCIVAWLFLRRCVNKRKRKFIAQFPEALDSIVRSVRAGYPLVTAIGMVADNIPAPLGTEFRRVMDEASFGFTLSEALSRMADRVDEADVQFFTVVLAVQQEAGGNLSESLNNLSSLLRKRRNLRLKILALSSEGRITGWILGALPLVVFLVVSYLTPGHFKPLFETSAGHILLVSVIAMVATGMLIVRQIVNMEV